MRDGLLFVVIGILLILAGFAFGVNPNDLRILANPALREEMMVILGGLITMYSLSLYQMEEYLEEIRKLRARLSRREFLEKNANREEET